MVAIRPDRGALMQTSTELTYDSKIEGDVVVTRVDAALNWFRKNSLWPTTRWPG